MTYYGSRLRTRLVPNKPDRGLKPFPVGTMELLYNGNWTKYFGSNITLGTYSSPYQILESTRDDVHNRTTNVKGFSWSGGGPFLNIKVDMRQSNKIGAFGQRTSGSGTYNIPGYGQVPLRYTGGYANPTFPGDPYESSYNDYKKVLGTSYFVPNITSWGPEAWARSAPKLEHGSGFTALSESKDVGPMLATSAKGFSQLWETLGGKTLFKKAGKSGLDWKHPQLGIMAPGKISDHYVNHQFGWAPFVSDVQGFIKNNMDFAEYYKRLKRDNGQWKHVRRTLLDSVERTKLSSGTGWYVEPSGYVHQNLFCRPGAAKFEVWEEKYTLVTTSGEFRYYIPDQDMNYPNNYPGLSELYAWLTMQGLRISPSSVWRATPWTWLIDWQFHIGRNLDRVTEALYDGVVCKYLYLMHHTIRRVVLYQTLPFNDGDVLATYARNIEVKQRIAAGSPFGFDSPWETLTPWRLSILGALGISRAGFR